MTTMLQEAVEAAVERWHGHDIEAVEVEGDVERRYVGRPQRAAVGLDSARGGAVVRLCLADENGAPLAELEFEAAKVTSADFGRDDRPTSREALTITAPGRHVTVTRHVGSGQVWHPREPERPAENPHVEIVHTQLGVVLARSRGKAVNVYDSRDDFAFHAGLLADIVRGEDGWTIQLDGLRRIEITIPFARLNGAGPVTHAHGCEGLSVSIGHDRVLIAEA